MPKNTAPDLRRRYVANVKSTGGRWVGGHGRDADGNRTGRHITLAKNGRAVLLTDDEAAELGDEVVLDENPGETSATGPKKSTAAPKSTTAKKSATDVAKTGEDDEGDTETETENPWAEMVGTSNVADMKSLVDTMGSVDELNAVLAAEQEGPNRKGVTDAINKRIAELQS